MQGWGSVAVKLGLTSLLASAAGCVPLTDYRKLETRFNEQEAFVQKHKDDERELERQQNVLTMRGKQQERRMEIMRARLKKSETIRRRLEGQVDQLKSQPTAVQASTPKVEEKSAPPTTVMGLEVNPETRGLVLGSKLLFLPGKAQLGPRGKRALSRLARSLNGEYAGRGVQIVGHTDDMPIRRSGHKSNWDLSAKRALAVLHFLKKAGVSADRLSFAGYGEHKPFVHGKSKAARAKNRRVEIVLFE